MKKSVKELFKKFLEDEGILNEFIEELKVRNNFMGIKGSILSLEDYFETFGNKNPIQLINYAFDWSCSISCKNINWYDLDTKWGTLYLSTKPVPVITYTEEEVLELLLNYAGENPINLKEWFEFNKKK